MVMVDDGGMEDLEQVDRIGIAETSVSLSWREEGREGWRACRGRGRAVAIEVNL